MRFLTLIIAVMMLSCISEDAPDGGDGSRVKEGDMVPEFAIDDFSSPEDFIGNKSLLVLFNSGCPDCQREMPFIDYACRNLPGLQAVAISRDESLTVWDYPMQYYPDPDRAVYNLFAEHTIPRIYLIDETATIVWMAVEDLGYGAFSPEKGDIFNALITNKLNI